MKSRDFKEGDRVVWSSPKNPGPFVGKIVCDTLRPSFGVLTLELDGGRKVAALQEHLKIEGGA